MTRGWPVQAMGPGNGAELTELGGQRVLVGKNGAVYPVETLEAIARLGNTRAVPCWNRHGGGYGLGYSRERIGTARNWHCDAQGMRVLATFWPNAAWVERRLIERALGRKLEDVALSTDIRVRIVPVKGAQRLAWRLDPTELTSLDRVDEALVNGHFVQPSDARMLAICKEALEADDDDLATAAMRWHEFYERKTELEKRIRAGLEKRRVEEKPQHVHAVFDCAIRPARGS